MSHPARMMRDMVDSWMNERAAEFRADLTRAEVIVWSRLRARRLNGYRFRRQHVIGRFIVDFYCAEKRVAVEIDGPTHHEASDHRRDRSLNAAGIHVVRVLNEAVYDDLDGCLSEILQALESRPSWRRRNGRTRTPR
jgi:very-short-patch-repair endonuclease